MIKHYSKVPDDLKGLIYASFSDTAKKLIFQVHRNILKVWLDSELHNLSVTTYEKDDVVLGYCLHEQKNDDIIIHAVFVKPLFRRKNIGKLLVDSISSGNKNVKFSIKTRLLDKLMKGNVRVS